MNKKLDVQTCRTKRVIDIISIMPEYFTSFINTGLISRAIKNGVMEINIINPRDFSKDKHKRVDDKIYGGGAGQLLMAYPILEAYESAKAEYELKYPIAGENNLITVIMSASGKLLNSKAAKEISSYNHMIVICGRYEGIDARVAELTSALEISIGDFVLSGGEIASIVLIEAVCRYFENFLGNFESLTEESFSEEYKSGLEYPQYTKPRAINNLTVPEVLLGGNHKIINDWRLDNAFKKTMENRPDLVNHKADKKSVD